MQLADLLSANSITTDDVLVFRHRPTESEFRRVLPWLAAEKPDVYNAYQQCQNVRAEQAMSRARYVASFIGHEAGKALFIGLYRVGRSRAMSYKEYWEIPANLTMKALGMRGFTGDRPSILWFDLELMDFYSEWKGEMIVRWPPPERSWWRWAKRNAFPIHAVLEGSLLDRSMPTWDSMILSWNELTVLPRTWRSAISQWRGIYYILDISDGKGYVGAAYGLENILGRWENYGGTGHGGNAQLRTRAPANFRFSILQRVSPDLDAEEVIRLESAWKDRLHTRTLGLNDN